MLKAVMVPNGMWRRNDGKGAGATYAVSGTPAEMEAFVKAQGQFLVKDKATGAIYFVRREFSIINGRRTRNILKPSLKLGILRDGTGVYVDERDEYIARDAAIEAATIAEAGKLAALQLMGINIGDSAVQQAPPQREPQPEGQEETPDQTLARLQKEADLNGSKIDNSQPDPANPAPPAEVKVAEPQGSVGSLAP